MNHEIGFSVEEIVAEKKKFSGSCACNTNGIEPNLD